MPYAKETELKKWFGDLSKSSCYKTIMKFADGRNMVE